MNLFYIEIDADFQHEPSISLLSHMLNSKAYVTYGILITFKQMISINVISTVLVYELWLGKKDLMETVFKHLEGYRYNSSTNQIVYRNSVTEWQYKKIHKL